MSLCECGCGRETNMAPNNNKAKGWVKGRPLRFIKGHIKPRPGSENPNWKGGKGVSSHGYIRVKMADGSRKYEHVLVAEQALGRPLKNLGRGNPNTEVVHHINGNKQDNRKENLLICTHRYHTELHHRLESSDAWPEFPKISRTAK